MTAASDDYNYIIRIIQFLDSQFAIRFFISSKDFDILYRWWEKRIPFAVVSSAMRRVVERRSPHKPPIASFAVFSHEVRRDYQSFLNLSIGRERGEHREEHDQVKTFLKKLPEPLDFLKDDFERLGAEYARNGRADAGPLHEKLLHHFRNDAELNAKCDWFMKNLAPALRRPEIGATYRLNYLLHKFSIPSFD
ncbi:MAG: hypothetical protein NTW95_01480 [Candidatus Aminicenantes bacterium]|nr:hypothetical protein [Candidatus Aminicenantes bacterium]